MEKTKNKRKYVREWLDYINACKTLTWTKDEDLSKEVTDAIDRLRALVPRVADTKDLK